MIDLYLAKNNNRILRLLVIWILITPMPAFAQQELLDSLEQRVNAYKGIDTVLINLRNDYAKQWLYSTPDPSGILSYLKETLEMSEELSFPKGSMQSYEKMGIVHHYFEGEPLLALDYYQKALDVAFENPKLMVYRLGSLSNMANIYAEQHDYNKALAIYRQLLKDFRKYDIIEQYLANVFGELEELDSAIYYYEIAIERADSLGNHIVKANNLSNLSLVLSEDGQLKEAKSSIEEALNLVQSYDIVLVRPSAFSNAAMIYLATKELGLAEDYALKALKYSSQVNNLFLRRGAYATLYRVYKEGGQYSKALSAYEEYVLLNDSITNVDKRIEFARKDIEYESKQRELLAEAEAQKQKFNKNIAIISSLSVGLIFLGGFWLNRNQKIQEQRAKEAEFKQQLAESKLVALRSQLNPHFIFNALNSIERFMKKEGVDRASEYLTEFAQLMRTILENTEYQWRSLAEEIKWIKPYVILESLRLDYDLNFELLIEETLDLDNTLIPSLMLQPFIENSFEHGLAKLDSNGELTIRIFKKVESLICVIEDNGVGFKEKGEESIPNKKSYGLKISKERIAFIEQLSDGGAEFSVEEKSTGIKVEIRTPYKTEFE